MNPPLIYASWLHFTVYYAIVSLCSFLNVPTKPNSWVRTARIAAEEGTGERIYKIMYVLYIIHLIYVLYIIHYTFNICIIHYTLHSWYWVEAHHILLKQL